MRDFPASKYSKTHLIFYDSEQSEAFKNKKFQFKEICEWERELLWIVIYMFCQFVANTYIFLFWPTVRCFLFDELMLSLKLFSTLSNSHSKYYKPQAILAHLLFLHSLHSSRGVALLSGTVSSDYNNLYHLYNLHNLHERFESNFNVELQSGGNLFVNWKININYISLGFLVSQLLDKD